MNDSRYSRPRCYASGVQGANNYSRRASLPCPRSVMNAKRFKYGRCTSGSIALLAGMLFWTAAAWAHHSYAMFDGTKTLTVSGTVAKLEWANPHVYVWVYVPNAAAASGYDLYAFENGSTGVLARLGWTKSTFAV